MRITVSMPSTGVFYAPGLAKPVVLDVDSLPKDIAEQLTTLAAQAGVLDESRRVESAPSAKLRDTQQFSIHVDDAGKQRSLYLSEPLDGLSEAMQKFVRLVRAQADLARKSRPGQ